MKIEYISHACILVDTGEGKILLDPWFTGPAYNNQWHLFPKPINTDKLKSGIDYILITHGHEDHLHEASLAQLPKTAHLIYPYTWYGDSTGYFKQLGFHNSSEALSWKRMKFFKNTYVTFISHNLDTIVVIESNGKVLVNVNDALPAFNLETIRYFTKQIKTKWPKIDYVFSGFGGASYFPNNIHTPFKNDKEIAALREELLFGNAFHIVNDLEPKIAVPFASDFVLLDKENLWINQTKSSKKTLANKYYEYYPEKKGVVSLEAMYSGDVLENYSVTKNSAFHNINEDEYQQKIISEYKSIIDTKANPAFITESDAEQLVESIKNQVLNRKDKLKHHASKMRNLQFDIHIPNVQQNNHYYVSLINGIPSVTRNASKRPDAIIQIDIRSDDLLYSFAGDWTGDVINIGYCAQVYVNEMEPIANGTEGLCLRLLTNHPSEDEYLIKAKLRSIRFILANPIHKDWFLKKLTRSKTKNLREALYLNDHTYDRNLWLTKNKCEICEICKMPNRDKVLESAG